MASCWGSHEHGLQTPYIPQLLPTPQRPPCSDPSLAGHAAGKGGPGESPSPRRPARHAERQSRRDSLMGLQQVGLASNRKKNRPPGQGLDSWCHRRRANPPLPALDSPQTFALSTPLHHSATGTQGLQAGRAHPRSQSQQPGRDPSSWASRGPHRLSQDAAVLVALGLQAALCLLRLLSLAAKSWWRQKKEGGEGW